MSTLSSSEIYIIVLLAVNFIGGFFNLFYLISFIKQSESRFVSSRNPSLIILYCIVGLIVVFITTPLALYYHGLPSLHSSPPPFFTLFATEFFHELCTTTLLIVILCRSWLLFYDYKFSECSLDLMWRRVVNAHEYNWFISHRKTYGNLHFLICLSLIFISISLLSLSGVGAAVLRVRNSSLFHYFSVLSLGIPLFLFIIYLTQYKIRILNDIYLIHREIKYLSYCILARIVAFLVNIVVAGMDDHLIFYSFEVFTTFLSVWIQCRWSINELCARERQKLIDLYIVMSHSSNKMKNRGLLGMIDIFDSEIAFESLIRHCSHELSVESMLFLIEIAQFKATLQKYNAFGINEVSFRFVDVFNSNLVSHIKKARRQVEDKQLIIHPLYDDEVATTTSDIISLRQSTAVASMKQESEYKRFTETILDKKWLPLNQVLTLVKDTERSSKHSSGTGSKTNSNKRGNDDDEDTKTKTKTKTATSTHSIQITKTKSLSKTDKLSLNNLNSVCHNEFNITPISLAVISDHYSAGYSSNDNKEDACEDKEEQEKKKTPKSPNDNCNESSSAHLTVDVAWMMEYARYLYLKYVDNSADLAINVSHHIRKDLWSVFSKEVNEEAFQSIELMHHEDLSSISQLTNKEWVAFMQTFVYHSFDCAFHCVWQLLKSDTFYRFQKTKEYKTLCADADKTKIKTNKDVRDREYSQSYQDSQMQIV